MYSFDLLVFATLMICTVRVGYRACLQRDALKVFSREKSLVLVLIALWKDAESATSLPF